MTSAAVDPVARVLVDVALAHLDRPFDYLVPSTMADDAVPGARVKVRFAGQEVDGFVLERTDHTDHTGRLAPLRRVVSAEPVLTPEVAELTGRVAARWAGTRSDVLRLAVPPRHATTEKRESTPAPEVAAPGAGGWQAYGVWPLPQRAVWSCLPGDDWAPLLARAAAATASSGRGALVCVPDHRDVARLDAALTELVGPGRHVVLAADAGPAKRYAAFLALSRGAVRIAVGTRAAAFAPVRDLGLVAMWDDGDDLYAEPRAPYPHAREVLLLRAQQTGCAVLLGGYARSVEAQYLVRTGWAHDLAAPRTMVRERAQVAVAGATEFDLRRDPLARSSRLPHDAHRAVAAALEHGPVLVQTPRSGYATRLACDACRTPAGCAVCHGPLRIPGPGQPPECAWCGTPAPGWSCPECGNHGLRAPVLGDRRTAEELGRAFPGVPVRTSSGERVLDDVEARPALVVATPGAEPVADGGYAAVLLMDTWLLLGRADLRAEEEALRRWANAAALVRPVADGGRVVVVGEPASAAVQALVRWDPAGLAERLIAERQSAHLPPASRVATLTAPPEVLEEVAAGLVLPEAAEVLGPVPVDDPQAEEDQVRLVVRVPRASGERLGAALGDLQRTRSARKLPHVRVAVDPMTLG
ncbi:primosomal protein N' [Nocardioides mangrovicus]|uniref:Probable replication restart protein PriA n=1 Tax=Nocardioides mangrovicus TaxID=2478913 RepID=A0A3L8P6L4_9ACTN|nr:primosomal protein N' [Nocardioides mangrovicus]